MRPSLATIANLCRNVAFDQGRAFRVVGVTSTSGGSDHVEVLVTVEECDRQPCRFVLNVSRADPHALQTAFRAKLREAWAKHLAD